MRRQWLARAGGSELTLVFGGWALGPAPFAALTAARDVLFVEDYRELECGLNEVAAYDRVRLLAYSFGVASAAHWLALSGACPARLVAVNGTLHPADPLRGIAPETVAATAAGLSAASFARFCRRAGVATPPPAVDFAARQAELEAIIARGPAPETRVDRIWIATDDRVVPPQAQEVAWEGQAARIRRIAAPHQPFRPSQSWEQWFA